MDVGISCSSLVELGSTLEVLLLPYRELEEGLLVHLEHGVELPVAEDHLRLMGIKA